MPAPRRSLLVYSLLAAAWLLVVGWQIEEHVRIRDAAKADLRETSKDIARTVSAGIRSMRFFEVIRQKALEDFLDGMVNGSTNEPVKARQILSVAVLNLAGDELIRVGRPIDLEQRDLLQDGEHWGRRSLTVVNPVDLGASLASEGITNTIIITNRPGQGPREFPRRPPPPDPAAASESNGPAPSPSENPPSSPETRSSEPPSAAQASASPESGSPLDRDGRSREGGFRPRGPRWLRGMIRDEKEYRALVEKRGLHGLVLAMSTEGLEAASVQDLLLRSIIVLLAGISAAGSALAWRNLAKSSELQIRLVRASEMTTHLKEMNLAAAGLAHETRNPLNIIRGLAQTISKQPETPAEVRQEARDILAETDKVAAQLNEFINYSRPREVRRVPLALGSVVNEIARALSYDIEEKKISFQLKGEPLSIEADEQLLRQALFNLILNAIQAVNGDGQIEVLAQHLNASEALVEVRDNGPGVPPERRSEIFKPYFTTQKTGTGLGLAVVQQIVLAHGWEIQCLPNEPHGAVFRITHLRLAPKAGASAAA